MAIENSTKEKKIEQKITQQDGSQRQTQLTVTMTTQDFFAVAHAVFIFTYQTNHGHHVFTLLAFLSCVH